MLQNVRFLPDMGLFGVQDHKYKRISRFLDFAESSKTAHIQCRFPKLILYRLRIYKDSLKNVHFFEIRYSPPFLCCLIDSIALKSMYELYIHSISLAIHRGRSVSGGAGFEVAVRQRGAPADGIDNRLRNRKNHEKSRFFDPKSIFSNLFQISPPTCPGHPPASPVSESCP